MTDDDGAVEVGADNLAAVQQAVIGRTIAAMERVPDSTEDWSHGDNSVTITLDDGSTLWFNGWGYDASGLMTYYTPPPE